MLEEYLCMGGNEVANNARAYGYAVSADCPLSWYRCVPCETIHDVVNDWIPADYRWLETTRNLITNPRLEVAATNYTESGSWTGARVADSSSPGGQDFVWRTTIVGTPGVVTTWYSMTVTNTQTYRVGFWVRATTTGGVTEARVSNAPNLGAPFQNAAIPTDGSWTWVTFSHVMAGSTITFGVWSSGTTNPTVDMTGLILVEGSGDPLTAADYFDGSTVSSDIDVRYRWSGTADASASVEEVLTLITEGYSAEQPYTWENINLAPWYDADRADLTSRFYGPYLVEVNGVDDSTRTATVTEAILDGGVVGLVRHASRQVTVRALLAAQGEDALEYGMAWLDAALEADDCSQHGASCGAVDVTFLASCPVDDGDTEAMIIEAEQLFRHLHNVTVTSGPLITRSLTSSDNKHYAYMVEWTMVAGTPWVFSDTVEVPLEPTIPVVVQDLPYNLVPYPSAERALGTVVVGTNYSTNPSVETNNTGWSTSADGVGLFVADCAGARSTDIAAVGVASEKVIWTAPGAGATPGWFGAQQTVTIPISPAGLRYSINIWAAAFVTSGSPTLGTIDIDAEWKNGGTSLRLDSLGSVPASGGPVSVSGILAPATANVVIVRVKRNVTSWAAGTVLTLYADALAVTVP